MRNIVKGAAMLGIAVTLAGCGDSLTEQALIGGGAGVAAAAVSKHDLATGALLGAAVNVAYCQKFPSRC